MSSKPQKLINSFIVISPTGKVQAGHDQPMNQADLTYRLKCTVQRETIITRDRVMDCDGRFLDSKDKLTQAYRYTWNFATVTPQLMAILYAYFAGAALSPTGTPADEIQHLARSGTVSSGNFKIGLTVEGRSFTTGLIAWNATAAAIQTAILKTPGLGDLLKAGDITVSGDWTAGMDLNFSGRFAKANLALVVITPVSLGGGGSIVATQTTAGDQNYHAFSNSTSDTKQEFSFVLGYKTGNLPIEEYYNAAVERFEPTQPRSGKVGLTISVVCNYEPTVLTGYSIPACLNPPGLKTSECSVSIDSEWKTRDISNINTSLNDNVPIDEDTFGVDSMNPELFERGDVPAYSISGALYGAPHDPDDNFAVAVRGEEKVNFTNNFGLPGNRFSLIAPQTILNPATNDRQHTGSRNRSVVSFDAEPARDGVNTPVRAEAYLDQAVAFLQASS